MLCVGCQAEKTSSGVGVGGVLSTPKRRMCGQLWDVGSEGKQPTLWKREMASLWCGHLAVGELAAAPTKALEQRCREVELN